MPFEEVFVTKGTGAMLMWADVISVAQMNHIVVRNEGFHRFEFFLAFVAFPVSAHFSAASTFARQV